MKLNEKDKGYLSEKSGAVAHPSLCVVGDLHKASRSSDELPSWSRHAMAGVNHTAFQTQCEW